MELIKGFVSAIVAIVYSAMGRQVTREFNAWTPWIVEHLVRRAVSKLPEAQRERFEEEWRSHIDEMPGDVGKLLAAIGFGSAARDISSILNSSRGHFLARRVSRRAVDICVSVVALIVLSPLMLTVGLLIRLDSGGPILFPLVRLGPNGQEFRMWKFRTMKCAVDRKELRTDFSGSVSHPGITPVGRLLRKYSLDELPIFLNVLRGDMSVVGPRPRD